MKSQLLASRLREVFGGEGESVLRQLLAGAASEHSELAQGVGRFLEVADGLVTQLHNLQQIQSELSGDAFSDWNLKSGRIDSGKQWKALLSYSDSDVDDTLTAWRSLVNPDDLRVLNAAIAEHVQRKTRHFQAECRLRSKSGEWNWLFLKGVAIARDSAGEATRLLVLHRDISELRRSTADALSAKEAAESANRARSYFMANMSHEIRTPMNGIIGMTELALDTQLDPEQRHYLRTVKSSAESLLAIVNDILDFSKIESGKLRFEAIPFSLSSLVFEAVRTQAVAAHKKGLEVIVSLAPEVPARVIGDPTRLRQVISNLVGNAVKFTERGEISVTVTLEEAANQSASLRFAVKDTGIGVPASRQGAIFEAFSQADDSTTRRFGGTGLGLTISSNLVQMMGGRIWLDSVEGEGSCFFFSVRFSVDSARVDVRCSERLSSQRAILLENNPTVAAQLMSLFAQSGMQATHFSSAPEALGAIEKSRKLGFPYDAVVVDALVPAPGGMALAEAWQGKGFPEKLIMLINTEQQRQDMNRLRALGVNAHLVKPVAFDDLIEALELVAGGKEESEHLLDPFNFEMHDESNAADSLEVLLVEDNPVNQELADRLLRKRGCRVTLANNGAEAVDYFEKGDFDVIFMDMQMPVMDGIEATESIRSREMRRSWVVSQDFRQVYIVAMTANAMDGDRDRCLQAGMNDYISKPVKPVDLYAALDRALSNTGGLHPGLTAGDADPLSMTSLDLGAAMKDLGDRDLLVTMAGMLVNEWEQHLSRIRNDLVDRNASQLCMSAHTVKSLLAIFHGETARRLALDLEHEAKRGGDADWNRCEQIAEALSLEMTRLKPEMEKFVRGDARV